MHYTREHFENVVPKIEITQFCIGTIVVHYICTRTYILCGIDKLFVPDEGMMVRLSCRIIHENMSDLSKLLCFHYLKNLIKMIIAVKLIEGTVLFHFGSHQPGETCIFCQNIFGDLNARSGSLF